MLDAFVWFFASVGSAFTNLFAAVTQPALWLGWLGGLDTVDDYSASLKASSGWLTDSVGAYRAQRDRVLG